MSSTLSQLQDIIVEKYEIAREELIADKSLADFGLDSLSQVELLFTVEEHFSIEIPEDRAHVANLNELAAVVDDILAHTVKA